MRKMTVRARLGWTFGGLALLVLLAALLAIQALNGANAEFRKLRARHERAPNVAHLVREAVDQRAIAVRNMVLLSRPEDIAAEKTRHPAHAEVTAQLQKLKELAQRAGTSEEVRRMIAEIDRAEQQYAPVALAIVDLAANQQREAAIAKIQNECQPLLAAMYKVSQQYAGYTEKRAAQLTADAAAQYAMQRNLLVAASVLAIVFAALAGWLMTRSITRALGAEPDELSAAVGRVAEGT